MNKKLYEKPIVKKIKLDIKNAVLAVCFSSSSGGMEPVCRDPDYAPCNAR